MSDPVEALLSSSASNGEGTVRQRATTPEGLGEIFSRGFDSGIEGIATDAEYFRGLFNTAIGDDEAAAVNIADARLREEQTANQFGDLQDFGEFVENPTLGGFVNQVTKNVGQVTPYLFSTIGGGLGGAATAAVAKVGLTLGSKHVTQRILKDALKNKIKGTATPEEERALASAYRLAQRGSAANKISLKGGAAAGMYAQEFTSMAGSNFGENLDFVDQDEAALRSAGLAIPQAFIGLKGEQLLARVLMKDLGDIATKRSLKEGSVFADFAKTVGKNTLRGATTEGAAELAQEGLSVANRFDVDDEYAQQDALLRLGESTFAGFFGGGAITGAGSVATGSLRGSSEIMSKAKGFIEQARQQQVNNTIDQEQYGFDATGYSTPEPRITIKAQLDAALNPETGRHSVWIEGPEPEFEARADQITVLEIRGEKFYAQFIPGRGTIISKNQDITEEVAKSKASDAALAEALQYSAEKPADSDVAVRVLNKSGDVVWEEATNDEGFNAAVTAAKKQIPDGGKWEKVTIEQALEDRATLLEREAEPVVKNMDIPNNVVRAVREKALQFLDTANDDSDVVIEIRDALGSVVSAEILPAEVAGAFQMSPGKEIPEGGSITRRSVKEAREAQEKDLARARQWRYTGEGSVDPRAATDVDAQETASNPPAVDAPNKVETTEEQDFSAAYVDYMRAKEAREAQDPQQLRLPLRQQQLADPDGQDNLSRWLSGEQDISDRPSGLTATEEGLQQYDEAPRPVNIGRIESYAPDDGQVREDTEKARAAFSEAFLDTEMGGKEEGETVDFSNPFFAGLSGSALKTATALKAREPKADIYIDRNDKGYQIMRQPQYGEQSFGEDSRYVAEGGGSFVSLSQFVLQELTKAKKSVFARKGKKENQQVQVDEKAVNLFDLIKTGQRIVATENRTPFNEGGEAFAQQQGFVRIMSELLAAGRTIKIGKQDISMPDLNNLQALDALYIEAGFVNGDVVNLGQLLRAKSETALSGEQNFDVFDGAKELQFVGDRESVIEWLEALPLNEEYTVFARPRKRTDGTTAERQEVDFKKWVENPRDLIQEDGEGEVTVDFDPGLSEPFSYAQPGSGVRKLNFGLENDTLANKVLNAARKTLALRDPVSVFNAAAILDSDPESQARYEGLFSDRKAAAYVKKVAQELLDKPEGGGRYIGFSNAHIILLTPDLETNPLETALVVGHELGHALFKEEHDKSWNTPAALHGRLWGDFQKARDMKDGPSVYKGDGGFEEWYADQVSYWANAFYREGRKSSYKASDPAKSKLLNEKGQKRQLATVEVRGLTKAHFKKLVDKLHAFYKELSKSLQVRFGRENYSSDFDTYIKEVVSKARQLNSVMPSSKKSGARAATLYPPDTLVGPNYEQKVIVRSMAGVIEQQSPGFVDAVKKQITKIINSDNFTPIYNFIFTADSRMRKVGNDILADIFYVRAQDSKTKSTSPLGFLKATALEGNAWYNRLDDMIDGDLNSSAVKESIDVAFSDKATKDLKGNSLAVRRWLDRLYDEYIEPSNTDIKRQQNYTPIVLKLTEIERRSEEFVQLLIDENPNSDPNNVAAVKEAVQHLVNYQQVVMEGGPIYIAETNPAKSAEKALKLTKGISKDKLKAAGFLEDSDVALLRYTNHLVKRVEWNRSTKDKNGVDIFERELKKLGRAEQAEVNKIVHKYLGYTDSPLSPMWRAINGWGSLLQVVAILPLATLGSLPELAGPVIASKEFGSIMVGLKEIVRTVKNRDEARALARDLGVVTSQSVANAMMSQSELEWMDGQSRKLTDGFFRVTLLDTYTKFTREFASNMGVRFLMNHSDPETAGASSTRYLKELGITAAEIKVWSDSDQDFTTPEGMKVRVALQRFVESSTLRPNAAERPVWASDPRWALAWQLKGFFYSYGKVILAGAKREASARVEGVSSKDAGIYASMAGAAGVFALMGIATLPLAMVGMELREYAKYGLAWAIPGIDHEAKNYFRTDDLTWPQYLSAAFSRSFAAGPVTIAAQGMQAADWGRGVTGSLAVVLGPTAETIDRFFTDGFRSVVENRMLPTGLL